MIDRRILCAPLVLAAAGAIPLIAHAYPDGAPWNTLTHAAEGCADCHMSSAPVTDSAALSVELGAPLVSGSAVPIVLRFRPDDAEIMGFLATFRAGETEAGTVAEPCAKAETRAAAIRSIEPARAGKGEIACRFVWHTPAEPGTVTLDIGAVGGNDDASTFGDRVHLKSVELMVAP